MAKTGRSPVEKELARQNQRLLRNLKRRFATIKEKVNLTGEESPALKQYEGKLERGTLKLTTRNLTKAELEAQHRELTYLNTLKTSRVKGYKNYINKWKPTIDNLKRIGGKDLVDNFYSLYNKLVEENGLIAKYKYELFEIISDGLINNLSDEEIRKRVMEKFDEIYDSNQEVELEDKIVL